MMSLHRARQDTRRAKASGSLSNAGEGVPRVLLTQPQNWLSVANHRSWGGLQARLAHPCAVRLGPAGSDEERSRVPGEGRVGPAYAYWTWGAAFPISQLDSRLKCPLCGSRRVALISDLSKEPMAKRIVGMPNA